MAVANWIQKFIYSTCESHRASKTLNSENILKKFTYSVKKDLCLESHSLSLSAFQMTNKDKLAYSLGSQHVPGISLYEAGFGRGGALCQTSDGAPSVSAWSLLHSSSFKSHSCKFLSPDQNFGLDYHTFQHMVGDCPSDFLQLAFNCCNVSPSHSPYPIIISSVHQGITAVISWGDTAPCGFHVLVLLKFVTNTVLCTEGFPKQLVYLWSILIS